MYIHVFRDAHAIMPFVEALFFSSKACLALHHIDKHCCHPAKAQSL
jgi:hypothetical protein